MHRYYLNNLDKYKNELNIYLSFIKQEIIEKTNKSYDDIYLEVWNYYEKYLLERFPYIGGDQSSGTKNLVGAYYFVALGEVLKTYDISLDEIGYLITLSYKRNFDKFPKILKKIMPHLLNHPKLVYKMLEKKDLENEKNISINEDGFKTKVMKPNNQYDIIYYTLNCPLANFAKKYGYLEYMPYICNLDYVTFNEFNIPFYREKTCASNDEYCDFKFKKDAKVVSYWPCHSLDDHDNLK